MKYLLASLFLTACSCAGTKVAFVPGESLAKDSPFFCYHDVETDALRCYNFAKFMQYQEMMQKERLEKQGLDL